MVTSSEMYWLTRFDGLKAFIGNWGWVLTITAGIIIGIALVVWLICSTDPREDKGAEVSRRISGWMTIPLGIGVVLTLTAVFIPTTKEYAAIKVVPAILNDELGEDLGDIYKLGMEWAKDELAEVTGAQRPCQNCNKTHQ